MFETPELTTSANAGPRRSASVETIQFLRFLAAMAVVLFHGHQAATAHTYQWLGYWFDMGAAGVHVFFVISGFVIMHTSYGARDQGMQTVRFLLKRFVRIFPIYWICCVAYVAYQNTFGTGYNLPLATWIGAIFLMPGDSSRIIGPGWTLSFELFFYLCFATILRLRALTAVILLTILFVATIGIFLVSLAAGGTDAENAVQEDSAPSYESGRAYDVFDASGTTVADVIADLDAKVPGIRNRLVDAGPVIRTHINVFVEGQRATLSTAVPEGAVVHVIPAVSGGAR